MTKYETNVKPHLEEITDLISQGMTQESIAKKYGIHRDTWTDYKAKYPELQEAVTKGQSGLDEAIESAVARDCKGYYVEETETVTDYTGKTKTTTRKRWIPANVTAQIFWLKNRKKADWVDTFELDAEAAKAIDINVNIKDLSDGDA